MTKSLVLNRLILMASPPFIRKEGLGIPYLLGHANKGDEENENNNIMLDSVNCNSICDFDYYR